MWGGQEAVGWKLKRRELGREVGVGSQLKTGEGRLVTMVRGPPGLLAPGRTHPRVPHEVVCVHSGP